MSRQLSIVIPACPESERSMIPDVAGMTIQTPRHYKVDTTIAHFDIICLLCSEMGKQFMLAFSVADALGFGVYSSQRYP